MAVIGISSPRAVADEGNGVGRFFRDNWGAPRLAEDVAREESERAAAARASAKKPPLETEEAPPPPGESLQAMPGVFEPPVRSIAKPPPTAKPMVVKPKVATGGRLPPEPPVEPLRSHVAATATRSQMIKLTSGSTTP